MPYRPLDPTTAKAAPAVTLGAPLTSQEETLATLREELLLLLGGREDVIDERLDRWINDAYRSLAMSLDLEKFDASYAMTLDSDQPFYLLPSEVAWVKRLSYVNETDFLEGGAEFEMIDEGKYRKLPESTLLDTVGTGLLRPSQWFRFNDMLVIWSTPKSSYEVAVDVRIRPRKLVEDTDSPLLPPEWSAALLTQAKVNAHNALEEFDLAALAGNEFVDKIRSNTNTKAEAATKQNARLIPVNSYKRTHRRRGNSGMD